MYRLKNLTVFEYYNSVTNANHNYVIIVDHKFDTCKSRVSDCWSSCVNLTNFTAHF